MAYKTGSSLAQIFILSILLAVARQAAAGRGIPTTAKNPDVKQPEFLFGSDPGLLIPGFGRVTLPPGLGIPGGGSIGATGAPGGYLPGGDDTFVPNPGFEVPIPGSVPANVRP